MNLKKLTKRTEFYVLVALIVLCVVIQARSGQFFTGNNLVDLARSLVVPAMFCVGEMLVLVSGGIDVSFPAIASVSMFVVSKHMEWYQGSVAVHLAVGTLLGLAMGSVNGFLIAKYRFNAFLVTLGTASVYTGVLFGALSAKKYPVPAPMYDLGKAGLFTASNEGLGIHSTMPVTVLFFVALLVVAWFLLRRTMLGRGIYALGGDAVAAERCGFNIFRTQMFIYCFVGALAGFMGVVRACMMLNCNPTTLNGMEMTCIAACVLGGASITGGRGTLLGVMLGITLITVMSTNLILLGISTYWQKVFTGLIILVGTGVPAFQFLRNQRRLVAKSGGNGNV